MEPLVIGFFILVLIASSSRSSNSSIAETGSDSEVENVADNNQTVTFLPDPLELPKIPEEILAILGQNPNEPASLGPEVHEELVIRWKSFLSSGINKEARTELIARYPPINNCRDLIPPKLNEELEPVLPERTAKMDRFLVKLQEQMAAGICAVAGPTNKLFSDPSDETNPILGELINGIKILADAYHSLSLHRRYLIMPYLGQNIKKVCEESPINVYLFGPDLATRIKASEELKKFGSVLKRTPVSQAGSSTSSQKRQRLETNYSNSKRHPDHSRKKRRGKWTSTRRERGSHQSSFRPRSK